MIWGCKVRRGAPSALGVGLALAAMAASGACAEVRSINLDECSGTCIASAIDDPAAAEDEAPSDITLSLIGGGATDDANDARPALVLDGRAMPTVLVSGLPSPIALAGAQPPTISTSRPMTFSRTSSTFRTPPTRGHSGGGTTSLVLLPLLISRGGGGGRWAFGGFGYGPGSVGTFQA